MSTTGTLVTNAYERHRQYISDYVLHYGGEELRQRYLQPRIPANFKTEYDIIKEHHKFIRDDSDGPLDEKEQTWEARLAKRYYDVLFKEYCLADLSRYREGKIAMRWRTQREVLDGKGQLICGSLACNVMQELTSFEVNFGYVEDEVKKELNYRKEKERKRARREKKRSKRAERSQSDTDLYEEEPKRKHVDAAAPSSKTDKELDDFFKDLLA
ncbi:hypothetical protein RI367_006579 [Sorochytrium milnesiophthora]